MSTSTNHEPKSSEPLVTNVAEESKELEHARRLVEGVCSPRFRAAWDLLYAFRRPAVESGADSRPQGADGQ
jgi:hypothetical protein